jgi:hypothetical protein
VRLASEYHATVDLNCCDFTPLLGIQDGRVGEWIAQCRDDDRQVDNLAELMTLWPSGTSN